MRYFCCQHSLINLFGWCGGLVGGEPTNHLLAHDIPGDGALKSRPAEIELAQDQRRFLPLCNLSPQGPYGTWASCLLSKAERSHQSLERGRACGKSMFRSRKGGSCRETSRPPDGTMGHPVQGSSLASASSLATQCPHALGGGGASPSPHRREQSTQPWLSHLPLKQAQPGSQRGGDQENWPCLWGRWAGPRGNLQERTKDGGKFQEGGAG